MGYKTKALYFKHFSRMNGETPVYATKRFSSVNSSASDERCYNTLKAIATLSYHADNSRYPMQYFAEIKEELE